MAAFSLQPKGKPAMRLELFRPKVLLLTPLANWSAT
jgi:hypothetical protein